MAVSFGASAVTNTGASSANSIAATITGCTAGSTLLVCVWWTSAAYGVSSTTCSTESNFYMLGEAHDTTNDRRIQFGLRADLGTGGNKTVTANFSNNVTDRGIYVAELFGVDTGILYDDDQQANGSSGNPTVNVTTSSDGEALFGAVTTSNASDPTGGAGFTTISFPSTSGNQEGEYKLDAGSAGPTVVDFTSSAAYWALTAVVIPAAPVIVTLPGPPTLSASGTEFGLRADIPGAITLSGIGWTDAGQFAGALPILNTNGAYGAGGSIGAGAAFNLPALDVIAPRPGYGSTLLFKLPVLALTATGQTGLVGETSDPFKLPKLTLSAAGHMDGLGVASPVLPILKLTLAAYGKTGHAMTAAFSLPVLDLTGSALQSVIGSASFNLPLIFVDATAEAALAEAYRTWVLNMENGALTEYNNFPFNSYTIFNGQVLACGPAGVVSLGTQALDNATAIAASWRTGMHDMDNSFHKRVPRIYHDGSQGGDLHFFAITKEGGSRTYLLPYNFSTEHTQRRVPVGKGPRSRFWQFGVDNVNGADFSTMSLLTYPHKVRRRIS